MPEFKVGKSGETEAQFRQFLAQLFQMGGSFQVAKSGVLGGTGLKVAQTTTASASVSVGRGMAVAQDTALNGASPLVNPTDKTLDVLGANPMGGVPRNDLVVFDAATESIRVLTGTPNAVPTDPTVPATAVPLARLRHNASATTVPTANIDDLRVFTTMRGGVMVAFSQADRDALFAVEGNVVYRGDTNNLEIHNGTGWDVFTPGRRKVGRATVTVNGTGYATITHGAGFTPSEVFAQSEFAYLCGVDQDTITSTTFQVRLLTAAGSPVSGSTKVSYVCYG